MRPKRIILVRHGESIGNVDRSLYATTPDYAITLSKRGKLQAKNAGKRIRKIIKEEHAQFYVSPYFRTRQTFQGISEAIKNQKHRDDPRLREQEWAGKLNLRASNPEAQQLQEEERDNYGSFFYRFEGGESCADVYDRISSFLDTLHRDFQKEDYPENAIIITHGMTIRVFLMRWLHQSVEEFELWKNPGNCDILVLEREMATHRYKLCTSGPLITKNLAKPVQKNTKPSHPYRLG